MDCRIHTALLVSCVLLLLSGTWGNAAEPAVRVSLTSVKFRKLGKYRGHENQVLRERIARFFLDNKSYRIAYRAGYDKDKPGQAFPLEGYIGMPGPCSCNWYHGGFLRVLLDGRDIGNTALSSMLVSETCGRGMVDLVWHHKSADVRVRFLGLPGNDCLFCEIRIEPRRKLKTVTIKLRCYPSFFTSFHKRKGARRIQTPGLLVEEGKKIQAAAGDNWWAVYYDEVFDPARREGNGPCAMLLDPDQATTIRFRPTGYPVDTLVQYKPEARTIRMVFWDFKGTANAAAIKALRENSAAMLARLKTLDFTPKFVREFDLAAMRKEMQEALADPKVRQRIGKTMSGVRKWLATMPDAGKNPETDSAGKTGKPVWSIRTEEQFLRSVAAYNDFIWQVKLARLLSGI